MSASLAPIPFDYVRHSLSMGTCPDCGKKRFLEGPHGGNCVNIECAWCRSRFNVFLPYVAERIGRRHPHIENKEAILNAVFTPLDAAQ